MVEDLPSGQTFQNSLELWPDFAKAAVSSELGQAEGSSLRGGENELQVGQGVFQTYCWTEPTYFEASKPCFLMTASWHISLERWLRR